MREDVKSLPNLAGLALLLLIVTGASVHGAEKYQVTDIAFETVARQNMSSLLLVIGLKVGDTLTESELWLQIEKDIRRLYSMGEFEEVGPLSACRLEDFKGGKRVVFVVKEKLRINAVYIQGGKAVGEKELTKGINSGKGKLVSEVDLSHDTLMLLEKCHADGYMFAEVKPRLERLPGAMADVTYDISLGPRTRIHQIRFIGNHHVPADELKAHMAVKERDFWFFGLITPGYFSSNKLAKDIEKIQKYLRDVKGYLEATVGLDSVTFNDTREEMIITLRIYEGRLYTLKGFALEIETPEKKPHFKAAELLDHTHAQEMVGKAYCGTDLRDLRQAFQTRYQQDGYLNSWVHVEDPKVELEGYEATAVFRIYEGSPVYARRIHVIGNLQTKDEVVRRSLAFGPGDLVTSDTVLKSLSNLHQLQFFSPQEVSILPMKETATPEGTDFKVKVEEGLDGQLMLGLGLASDMGVIGSFILRKKNFDFFDWPESFWDIPNSFKGAGQIINIEVQPGTYYSHYRVSFTEPHLFNRWYGLNVYGVRSNSHRDTWDVDEWGAGFRLDRYFTFNRDVLASLGYRYNVSDIGSVDPNAPQDAFDVQGTTRISALSLGFQVNKYLFDPYAGPYKGFRLWTKYEYGGGFLGAHVDYSKGEAGVSYFLDIFKDRFNNHHVLTMTGNFGWMEPHHNTPEIPLFERFWLGGPNTMRGFRFYGVGPHENGEEIGGTAMVYGNVEYSFPLFFNLVPLQFLRGVVFFDWGQLEGPYNKNGVQKWDFGRLSMNRMRTSAGAGLRISLNPLGLQMPVSMYWGEAIDSQDGDRPRQFLFHIGSIGF